MTLRSVRLAILIFLKYLDRHRMWVVGTVAIIFILLVAQLKFNLFYSTNMLGVGLVGTFQEHDLPTEATSLVSESLVNVDSEGRIKPNLVSGWEVNNDATNFKFKLKDNLKWADGSMIKASDLIFDIPNTDVSFPDDKTIEFHLKEAYSPLPSLLTKPILKKGTLLGTGPYQITKVEKSRIFITKLTLQPHDPKLPEIFIRFYPNEKVAITGFNLGEVQALLALSNITEFVNTHQVAIKQKVDFSKIVTILFQTKDPLLSSRSLRQALSFVTPKIKEQELADNPYPHKFWAYDKTAKKYLSNPEEAKQALERAKSQIGEDKLHSEIILTTTPNLEEQGNEIVASWKNLGFDGKLRVESGIPQNFQALLITQSIPSDPDQYFLWHATQTKTNLTKYDSKRADKDLEDGRKIITEEDRKQKYFDFQRTLLEDAPATFLYFPKYNIVYLKKVEGMLNKVLELQK